MLMLMKMRSSPKRTFSPSERCLLAGCIVHQQLSSDIRPRSFSLPPPLPELAPAPAPEPELPSAAPSRGSRSPTSNASLSFDELDVARHAKYCAERERQVLRGTRTEELWNSVEGLQLDSRSIDGLLDVNVH